MTCLVIMLIEIKLRVPGTRTAKLGVTVVGDIIIKVASRVDSRIINN